MGTAKQLPFSRVGLVLGLFALALAGPAAAQGEDGDGYGYIRVLEGQATLIQAGSGDRDPAEINQPLLVGDRLIVPGRSRLEIVLADGNLVRLDGGSELILEHLADSPDAHDRATVLRLQEGNLQLIVLEDSQGEEYPRVETPSATVFVQSYGTYRVTADRNGWSEVLVRRGLAEVVTDRGEAKVRADEQAVIDAQYAGVDVRPAASYDSLERWAQRLDEDFQSDVRYVDDDLRYRAAPLNRHGTWISYNNARYWQPRVSAGWRPYWDGRWAYTPSGLTWVSYEPWGWVPYHYGSWDYLPGYGWAWAPGRVWAPAWVYWYWGPSYTSWCPVGYYTHYYASLYGWGFHHGVYGWAGGHWDDNWGHWNWVRNDHFGRRDQRRYAVPTDELRGRMAQVPRGVITTDTRGVKPDTWGDPGRVARVLQEKPNRVNPGRELADVTPFIARKPELPDTVVRTVRGEKPLPGTPFQPGTPGGRGTVSRGDDNAGMEKPRPRVRITNEQPQEMPGAGTDTPREEKPRRTASRPAPTDDGGYAKPETDRPRRVVTQEKPRSSDPENTSGSYGRSDDDKPAPRRVEPPSEDKPAPRHIEPPQEDKPEPQRAEPQAEDKPAPRHIEPPSESPSQSDTPDEKPSRRPPAREDGGETRSYRSMTGGGLRSPGLEKPAVRPERTEQQPEPRSRRTDRPETRSYERPEPRVYERPTTRSTQSTRSDEKPAPRVYERPERREEPSSRPSSQPRSGSTQRDASTPRQRPEPQSSGSTPSYDKPREAPRSVERREEPQRQSSGNDGGGHRSGGRSRQKPPQ
ncbi:MAG TPA: DUF6600 domain-containing protein [Thermoanaerobaculia bacterium]|nr:DUF6600 domain-containing protein [Thermoanaerobaculia bacterium]